MASALPKMEKGEGRPASPEMIEDKDNKDLYTLRSTSISGNEEPVITKGIDAEVAEFFAQEEPGKEIVIDDALNRSLRWKVHKRVLVVMVTTYFAQTLDKGLLNFASIMGIIQDTKLHGQQLAWLTTCVYIAILVWELPTNRLIQRLPIAKYLGFNIMAWGAVLACTAACKSFTGLVVVRTLLGLFECVCQPAFVYMSTIWYTRSEQPLIIGSFYSMNGFQQCVGGLLAYGIQHFHGHTIKNWQFYFTLLGCVTVVWGLFVLYWLPDSPMRAKCFSKEDRLLMAERVRGNDTGIQNRQFKMYQVLEAFKDPVVWGVTLVSFTNALPTGGLGAFSNLILNAFGFTVLQTYLLAIAQGTIIMLFLFTGAYLSTKYHQRLLTAIAYTIPNVIGSIVFLTVPTRSDTKVGLLIAFYCTQGFGAVAVLNIAVMSGNIAGRTKQVIANSMIFIAWAAGNAIGPQVFRDNDKPRYIKAFIVHMVMYGLQIVVLFLLRLYLMRRNVLKRRERQQRESGVSTKVDESKLKKSGEEGEEAEGKLQHRHAFDDLTDWENPDFRYVY